MKTKIFLTVSTGHFDPLIEVCNRLTEQYDFLGQIGSSTVAPNFPFFRVGPHTKIIQCMQEAELVISHGGAGITSMLYQLKKPNVIIPKQRRYGEPNDLQVELAEKWAELEMTVLCMDVNHLEEALLKAKSFLFQFPEFPMLGNEVRKIIGGEV